MNANPAVPLRVIVVGLGTIGRAVAKAIPDQPGLTLVGGVDLSAAKLDRARADIGGDIAWTADVETLDAIDIAIVTAGPQFDRIAPTIRQLIRNKTHVVSDCAEMSWPWLRHPHLADVLAGEVRKAGVVVLGTGVWPGVMSAALPLTLATTVMGLKQITVRRTIRPGDCRPSVRRRAGLTLTPARFRTLAREKQVGLAGVAEAATLIAQGVGRHPTSSEIVTAVALTTADDGTPLVRQTAAYTGGGIDILVEVTLGESNHSPTDVVRVEGDRVVEATLPATPDIATAAVMVNAVRRLPTLSPGLRTILDLPGR